MISNKNLQWGLVLITLLLTKSVCAAPLSVMSDDIVGGSKVSDRDTISKSVVALYREEGGQGMLCSATLIAKNMAVTAAHCVEAGTDGMVVIFGTDIKVDAQDAVRVIGSEIQPLWSAQHSTDQDMGDIAVVRFESDAPANFKPAHMASNKLILKAGDTVTLAGFGITQANSQAGAGVLRKADVQVVNPDFGKTEMIFDQTDGAGACHGDSGGPAFAKVGAKTYLVGVTNRSYPDSAPDNCKQQVVYTKIMAYRAWITSSEKELKRLQ
jgi:secreted trypsin-like serine protease